jgi:hypothetical protein
MEAIRPGEAEKYRSIMSLLIGIESAAEWVGKHGKRGKRKADSEKGSVFPESSPKHHHKGYRAVKEIVQKNA